MLPVAEIRALPRIGPKEKPIMRKAAIRVKAVTLDPSEVTSEM
jgi:hypothetical protein